MGFSQGIAATYESWYDTPSGSRADALEKATLWRLLRHSCDVHSVLEVGAGTGHFSRWLAAEGLVAVGLDLSPSMLTVAQGLDGVGLVQADAMRLPFGRGAFDVVAFITTLEFLPEPTHALREALRVARRGLLLGVLNRHSLLAVERRLTGLRRPSVYRGAHFYSVGELKRLLQSLVGPQARVVWDTTLLPRFCPSGHRFPWGGFIGMALWKPGDERVDRLPMTPSDRAASSRSAIGCAAREGTGASSLEKREPSCTWAAQSTRSVSEEERRDEPLC